jgi:hypothetical protein
MYNPPFICSVSSSAFTTTRSASGWICVEAAVAMVLTSVLQLQ